MLIARMSKFCIITHYALASYINYFDKKISDLYLAKFLDASAKLFFPCIRTYTYIYWSYANCLKYH